MLETRTTPTTFVVSNIFNEDALEEASLAATEWLAEQDAKRAKACNFMQDSPFTPIYWAVKEQDKLISHANLIVLGRMLGYCQMSKGHCSAALAKIAKQVHLSLNTVKRSVEILEVRGYIEDTTPNRLKAPHAYAPTEKLAKILKKSGIRMSLDF